MRTSDYLTERITDQKLAVRVLVVLYQHSSEVAGSDAPKNEETKTAAVDPRRFLKKALQGVKMAATTTTTAFGNVASEIAGR